MDYKIKEIVAMNIIKSIPIIAAGEIEIAADPKVVWDVIAGINRWPR